MFSAKDAKQEVMVAMSEQPWKSSVNQLHLLDVLKEIFKVSRFEGRQLDHSVVYVCHDIVDYIVDNLEKLGYTVEDQRVSHNKSNMFISW